MKYILSKFFLIVLFSSFLITIADACKRDDSLVRKEVPSGGKRTLKAEDVKTENIKLEAKNYFDNLKTIITATKSYNPQVRTLSNDENPLIEKLDRIEIEEENEGKPYNLFTLPEDQKEQFLNEWALLEAAQMS